jgi:hypothetical protein
VSYIIQAYIVAIAYLYCAYGLGMPLLYAVIVLFQAESIFIEPCVIYKTIYNNTFLNKEFLYS